jgi:hypothetical protein
MSEPRLYLYRKAGRTIWDAEMWLPDGRRTTWRTGLTDRDAAERAARKRLEQTVGIVYAEAVELPADDRGGPVWPEDAPLPGKNSAGEPSPAPIGGWSARLDAWFFGDLRRLTSGV